MDDESVSKLNSMSGTLQCMACVSPVCERRVMSVFASAVGQGHLHIDVVSKVCVCVCVCVCVHQCTLFASSSIYC